MSVNLNVPLESLKSLGLFVEAAGFVEHAWEVGHSDVVHVYTDWPALAYKVFMSAVEIENLSGSEKQHALIWCDNAYIASNFEHRVSIKTDIDCSLCILVDPPKPSSAQSDSDAILYWREKLDYDASVKFWILRSQTNETWS